MNERDVLLAAAEQIERDAAKLTPFAGKNFQDDRERLEGLAADIRRMAAK